MHGSDCLGFALNTDDVLVVTVPTSSVHIECLSVLGKEDARPWPGQASRSSTIRPPGARGGPRGR
jgi:hypothetical protein